MPLVNLILSIKKNYNFILISFLFLAFFSTQCAHIYAQASNETYKTSPIFGGPTTRSSQASGFGSSENDAITDALKNAVQQETGARINSDSGVQGAVKNYRVISVEQVENLVGGLRSEVSTENSASSSLQAERSLSAGMSQGDQDSNTSSASSFNESMDIAIQSADSGSSTSLNQLILYHWRAVVDAEVFVFESNEDNTRPKIVIAPPTAKVNRFLIGDAQVSTNSVITSIQTQITNTISETRRFEVLQRGSNDALEAEIAFINSGSARSQESSRLGQQFSADIILATEIETFEYRKNTRSLRSSDRQLISYDGRARVTVRLLNPTTGVLVASQSFAADMPAIAETTMPPAIDVDRIVSNATMELSSSISGFIIRKLFPITVVSLNFDEVILSQGGNSIETGSEYEAVILGDELLDPQTGARLGRVETYCCTIRISRVSEFSSSGTMLGTANPRLASFVPGMIELREKVPSTRQNREPTNTAAESREPVLQIAPSASPEEEEPVAPAVDPDW